MIIHYITKRPKEIVISNDLENNFIEYDNIDYWIEDLQSIKVDESILLDSNGWLSDQYLASAMQILYVENYNYWDMNNIHMQS
jgi:hypothetical protein